MSTAAGKGGRYHHGDLRAALIGAAVEIIGEGGVRAFSLARASRRLGVAASAPYAHFADRHALLAAVTVHAYQVFCGRMSERIEPLTDPARRLAAIAGCFVRFAGTHRALFEVMVRAGIDKRAHPEVAAAEKPLDDAVAGCVRALYGTRPASDALVTAVEATAHGYAVLLLDGDFGTGTAAVDDAAGRAAAATLALVESRHLLDRGDAAGR